MTENDYQILLDVIEPLAGEWLADNPQVSDEAIICGRCVPTCRRKKHGVALHSSSPLRHC